MNTCGISDSVTSALREAEPCPSCASTSRVGRGLCLRCLLQTGFEGSEDNGSELAQLLEEIDVRDADWRLGNYQILEEIGRGGMGVIYCARQRHSRRIVALKRVLSYHADSRDTLMRFRREAEAAASLDHPNILPIYEVSESEDGLPYFSMKFAPGGSLFEAAPTLREEPRRAAAIMAKVARAVQYAHLHGILHRDLKPGNILLDARGEPLVSDFGLAKWLDTTSDLTRTLTIFGTPGYIAPEQAQGPARNLSPAADIYSLGAILFDLLTSRPPFLGEHALAVIQQASEKPAPKLRALAPHLDRALETICAKCLERDPRARYRSAGELAEDLEHYLEGRPIIARPVSPPVRICRWSKRNPKLAGSVAACLLLSAVAGQFEIQNRVAERETALSMHSIAVEPFLDLDLAQYDVSESGTLAAALQRELSNHGPARVIPVSRARRATVGGDAGEVTDKVWNGARIAMQGTKRVRGDKLRLSLRLLNTADNTVIYRRLIEADDAKRLLLDVVKAIADNINALLSAPRLSSIESTEVDPGWRDASSRELLIAGKAVQERRTLVDMTRAADLFERAVKAKPNSALAYSWLAEAQYGRAFLTGNSEFLSAAEASAQVALQLNPTIADTHKALGLVLFEQGRFNESLEEAFTAFELADQDDSRLPARVASNLRMLGNPEQAAAWYRLGLGKNARPGNYEFSLADCLVDLVDDKRALAIYSRASILFPELPEGWIGLCRLALLQKDFALAHKISAENWTHYRDYVFSEEMRSEERRGGK